MTKRELAAYIDYFVLKPEFTEEEIAADFGWIRGGQYEKLTGDLKQCAETAHRYGKELKAILETDALNEEQIRQACRCCVKAGADFVKTSTGFLTGHDLKKGGGGA